MNCRTAKKHVLEYHDAEQSREQQAALEAHLATCNRCTILASKNSLAVQWLRQLPEARPSENFDWRLRLRLSRVDKERLAAAVAGPQIRRSRRWTLQFAATAAAAAAVVLGVGLTVFWQPAPEQSMAGQIAPPADAARRPARIQDHGLPSAGWPRLVPTSAGVPLGPQDVQAAAPSILGEVKPDSSRGVLAPAR
ncbi:MAG: anti-sigma factor family protein [Candidatus Krumholzibacteriia bacterium]